MFSIVNQSKYLDLNKNQSFYVELGDAYGWQTQEQRRNEWLFRTYWQCVETISKGGYVYWDTLSYDNEHLPHISDFFSKYNFKHWQNPIRDEEGHILEEGKMVPFELTGDMNFSCFSHEDYRYFLVRLRRKLEYRGMDVAHNLKYFLTCEYGSDNVYKDANGRVRKGTVRPHYHIIFFILNPDIDAFEFSRLVSECWGKGRTDGLPYKSHSYVSTHNIIRANTMITDNRRVRKVCNYIAKYVNKDGDWRRRIEERIEKVFKIIYEDDFWKDDKLVDKYKKLIREIDVFHRQSQGFGEYALEAQDEDEIRNMLNTGMMSMPDDEKGEHGKHIPIPKYYQMKIFWIQYRDENGSLRWKRTQLGGEFGLKQFHRNWKRQKMKIDDWWNNMPTYAQFNDGDMRDYNSVREQILKLLDGRSLQDLVDYRMIYKGRVRSRWSMETGNIDDPRQMLYNRYFNNVVERPWHFEVIGKQEVDVEHFIYYKTTHIGEHFSWYKGQLKKKWIEREIHDIKEKVYDRSDVFYNYATRPDKLKFGRRFIINKDLGDKDTGYDYIYGKYDTLSESYTGKEISETSGYMTPMTFGFIYCYNQNTHEKFRNFDDIISLMDRFDEGYKQTQQKTYDSKNEYKKRLADNGFYIHTKI